MNWLWNWDRATYRLIHVDWRHSGLDPVMKLVTDSGLGHVQAAVLLLLAISKQTRAVALGCLAAGAFSGLVRICMVDAINRQRPSNFDFASPMESVFGNSSFPSGHSTTSFAIATMVTWMLPQHRWLAGLVWLWALLVGYSRVYVGVHYPVDIIGGLILGTVCATAVALFWRRKGWVPYPAGSETTDSS